MTENTKSHSLAFQVIIAILFRRASLKKSVSESFSRTFMRGEGGGDKDKG